MKKRTFMVISLLMMTILVLGGCAQGNEVSDHNIEETQETQEAQKIKVFASFYPLYDFANRIGQERIDLQTIVPSGTEPHSFEIPTRTLAQLEAADVFIYNGAEMEPWIDQILELLKDKEIIIVNASEAVDLLPISDDHGHSDDEDEHHDDHGHSHDEGEHHDEEELDDDHHHGDYDPHIWVDPINAIKISEQIKLAFVERDPAYQVLYEENFEAFKVQLEKLDEDFRAGLQDVGQRKIIVSHSAFGYLTHRYDLEEISVSGISPHSEPSPGRLAELTKIAREEGLGYIFFEVLANPRTAQTLADEANLEVLTLNNLEGLTEAQLNAGEDYISLMYQNLETLQRALMD